MIEPELKTRRWRRVEYERLVELGVFTGERLELLDGLLVVREPQGSLHAATVAQVARVLERAFGARLRELPAITRTLVVVAAENDEAWIGENAVSRTRH